VDTIDKKDNFPTPQLKQRQSHSQTSPSSSGQASNSASSNGAMKSQNSSATSTGNDARGKAGDSTNPQSSTQEKAGPVISPELRGLLSRKVEVLDKKDLKAHGGGVGN
jgi:TBC1 domain family member 15